MTVMRPRPQMRFAPANETSLPLYLIPVDGDLPHEITPAQRAFVGAAGFSNGLGVVVLLPAADGGIAGAIVGYGTPAARARVRFGLAGAAARLPAGNWHLVSDLCAADLWRESLGWLLEGYRFDRYAKVAAPTARLVCPAGIDADRLETIAQAEAITRDLINTPANDMGPAELADAVTALGAHHGASVSVIAGDDLLAQGYPLIHAVGVASPRAPRLIDLRWGDSGPTVTLVGKGVCFDTGGLNLKPGSSMGLMKKDMGGAATQIGLAHMIMALKLPVQLRLLIPAVENAVAGNAFRPGDVFTSRKGLTVEINNTDAEGRLVLADALAAADEESPDLIVCMATLTGAARVALGADLPPFYTDDDAIAAALADGAVVADPLWRMPFWAPYESQIEPGIADLDNAPKGGMAGSITAALFLRRFVTETDRFVHFDIYGWRPDGGAGTSKGGFGQGARAVLHALPQVLSL